MTSTDRYQAIVAAFSKGLDGNDRVTGSGRRLDREIGASGRYVGYGRTDQPTPSMLVFSIINSQLLTLIVHLVTHKSVDHA